MKIGRKVAISLIAVTTILMINTKVQAAQVKIDTDTLKLRKEPSTSSTVLELLSIGEKYDVIEEDGDWYKIKAKGIVGYVSKDYVKLEGEITEGNTQKPEENPEPEQPETSNPTETTEPQAPVQSSSKQKIKEETELRILPLFSSVSIDTLKKDVEITVITTKNNWTYVQTDSLSGWILASKLGEAIEVEENNVQEEPEETEETSTPEQETTTQNAKTAYINGDNVNFRKEASTSSAIIKKLSLNTEVKVISETTDWCKVEVNGTTGYVSKDFVSNTKKEVTSRTLEKERITEEVKQEEKESIEETKNVETVKEVKETKSSKGEEVLELAKSFLGNKYVWGAAGPKNFDCSGYTQYIYKQFGVSLPRTAATQLNKGTTIEKSDLQVGDAVFFQDQERTKVGHVGIYMGDGNFIHSSSAVGKVTITPLSKNYYETRYVGARRYVD